MFRAHRIPITMRVSYESDSKAGFCYGLMHGMVIYFLPFVALKSLAAGDMHIKLMSMAPFLGAMLTLLWTHLFRKLRKLPYVVWTKAMARVMLLLLCLAFNAWQFALIVFLFWIFESMASPAYSGIMKEVYLDSHRALAMGYVRVQVGVGQVIGAALAGFLLHTPIPGSPVRWLTETIHLPVTPGPSNYAWLFALGVGAGAVGLLFFHRLHEWSDQSSFTADAEAHLWHNIRRQIRRPVVRYHQALVMLGGLCNLMCIVLYPVFLVEKLHIEYDQVAVLGALQAICGIASYYFFASVVDRKNLLAWHSWTFAFFALASLIYIFAGTFTAAIFAVLCLGFGSGGWDLVRSNFLIRISPKRHPQAIFTLDMFLMGVRGVIAPILGFVIARGLESFRVVFALNVLAGLVCGLGFLYLARRYPDGRPPKE